MTEEKKTKTICCDYTKNVVCPYCGCEHDYTDRIGAQDEVMEEICNDCEKEFTYTTDFDITFISSKKESK